MPNIFSKSVFFACCSRRVGFRRAQQAESLPTENQFRWRFRISFGLPNCTFKTAGSYLGLWPDGSGCPRLDAQRCPSSCRFQWRSIVLSNRLALYVWACPIKANAVPSGAVIARRVRTHCEWLQLYDQLTPVVVSSETSFRRRLLCVSSCNKPCVLTWQPESPGLCLCRASWLCVRRKLSLWETAASTGRPLH